VYRVRPAANPGTAAHVLVLVAPRPAALTDAFVGDTTRAPTPPARRDTTP
jgi:hypothetical protein